jgi:hypothetical protein
VSEVSTLILADLSLASESTAPRGRYMKSGLSRFHQVSDLSRASGSTAPKGRYMKSGISGFHSGFHSDFEFSVSSRY